MATRKTAAGGKQTGKTKAGAGGGAGPGRGRARPGEAKGGRRGSGSTRTFEGFLGSVKRDFASARDVLARELDRTLDAAKEKIEEMDEERLKQVQADFRNRMREARERLGEAKERVVEVSKRVKEDQQVQAAADAGLTALHGLASSLRHIAERVEGAIGETRSYTAGESVPGGTYECRGCTERVTRGGAGRLQPCATCGDKKFKRIG